MEYSRKKILDILIQRVNSFADGYRQNIALIGEPCIGKTLLVKNLFLSESIKKDRIMPLYLEIKIEPFDFCAKRFIKSALSQLLKLDPFLTASQDTVLLIEDLARNYPKTAQICKRVLQDLEKNKQDEAFSFMMDIPMALAEETEKRPILILDEFHNMGTFALKNPFGAMAKKIMLQKNIMYFLISSKNTLSQRLLNEKLAMLFGNFEKILLLPFDIAASRQFLQQNIKGTKPLQIYLDFIASFTGNRPFYMHILADEIERAVFSRNLPAEDYTGLIEYAFTEAVFKKRGLINQCFINLLSKLSEGKLSSKSIAVLLCLSAEYRKQHEIVRSSRLQANDVSKILNLMIETDTILRNGVFYRFKDKLFHFWLQSVYLKRIQSFSIDEEIEEQAFRKDINNKLRTYLEEFEKEFSLRVIDLFKSFKNDIIQLNGKKHKFISFADVKELRGAISDKTNIVADNGRQKWLCTIKKSEVNENDVAEIIKSVKNLKRSDRINRNIIITPSGIDENAYLMAKEAKLWAWDMETLNILMELYGKPPIIEYNINT